MNAWMITYDYDGEWLVANSQATPAGVQDLGLPAHTQRRRVRVPAGSGHALATAITELGEELLESLVIDAQRLARELEQLSFPVFANYSRSTAHIQRVRRVVLGRRG